MPTTMTNNTWTPTYEFTRKVCANKLKVYLLMSTKLRGLDLTKLVKKRNNVWKPLLTEYQCMLMQNFPHLSKEQVKDTCFHFFQNYLDYSK